MLIFRGNDVTHTVHASRHVHGSEACHESEEMYSVTGALSHELFLNFEVLLTVHLGIILVTDQLNAPILVL